MPVCGHCGAAVLSSQRTCPMCTREVNPAGKDLLTTEQRKPKSRTTRNYGASVPDLDSYAYSGDAGTFVSIRDLDEDESHRRGLEPFPANGRVKQGKKSVKTSHPNASPPVNTKARVAVVTVKSGISCFQVQWSQNKGLPHRSREFPSGYLKSAQGMEAVRQIHADFLRTLGLNGWRVIKKGKSWFDVLVVNNLDVQPVLAQAKSEGAFPSQRAAFGQIVKAPKAPYSSTTSASENTGREASTTPMPNPPLRPRGTIKLVRVSSKRVRFELFRNGISLGEHSAPFAAVDLATELGRRRIEGIRQSFVSALKPKGWGQPRQGQSAFETFVTFDSSKPD